MAYGMTLLILIIDEIDSKASEDSLVNEYIYITQDD